VGGTFVWGDTCFCMSNSPTSLNSTSHARFREGELGRKEKSELHWESSYIEGNEGERKNFSKLIYEDVRGKRGK